MREAEANKQTVELQAQALAANQVLIERLQADIALRDQAVIDANAEIQALTEKLEGITDNLGPDADQPAANSIREVIDRLRALEQ